MPDREFRILRGVARKEGILKWDKVEKEFYCVPCDRFLSDERNKVNRHLLVEHEYVFFLAEEVI